MLAWYTCTWYAIRNRKRVPYHVYRTDHSTIVRDTYTYTCTYTGRTWRVRYVRVVHNSSIQYSIHILACCWLSEEVQHIQAFGQEVRVKGAVWHLLIRTHVDGQALLKVNKGRA